jgi:polyisoprenoid-binding protein YceI
MKKNAAILFFILHSSFFILCSGQIYIADSCKVSFFSSATIENITAVNSISKPVMSTATGDIQISITNEQFIFKKKLMQEHFNEDYMESDKYPNTVFKGKVNEKVDYTRDGVNTVTVTGIMDMHGVQKTITIPGTITVQNGVLYLSAKFEVNLADYKIKVPTVIGSNIAKSIAIAFNATMKPYQMKNEK